MRRPGGGEADIYPPAAPVAARSPTWVRRRRRACLGRLNREQGGEEEAVVGWALGTVHFGQCTEASFSFYRKGFSNILTFHKILQKCETWSHNYFAISSTATKSLGIFGVQLNLHNKEKGILKAIFALLKCIRTI